MTGWRLWTVRASHAAVGVLSLWRWAATGNGDSGVVAACMAFLLALTFIPRRRRS